MLKNKLWLGIILSIILLIFSINGFTAYYKYTQESGTNFYVGVADKADALEDTNEMRQIIDDLGALLVHSKRNDLYPKDATTGGTIQIPEAGLKFSNAPVNDDIAAYIAGEMAWQTKAELGLDLSLYYLKTAIDTIGEVETIWVKDITDSDELASALAGYYLKTAIDTQGEVETIWGVSLANDSELHTILTLGTASGLSLDGQELSLAVADTDTTGALSDTDWDTFNNKLSNITGESIGDLGDVDLTDIANLKILKYNSTSGNWECEDETGGGASTFVELTDTPASYTGQAGLYAKVNAGETALEFGTPAGGVDTSGTPEALDIARFTDVDTIEGINYTELKTALALSSDDLSDVASIAMLDENEIVTVCWYFHDIVYQEYESDLSTYYPQWGFIRRRDGDPTYIVTTGDILGATTFSGGYNEDPLNGLGAVIRGVAEGTFASGDYPTRLEFLTVPNSSSTLTLRMAIDNAGNIKMGDGAWTNYVNISNLGVLTLEGTANIEGVDATELSYLDGVTSDIQTQIDAKKGKNYYSALGSDHTYSNNADTDSQPVGEAVAFGDLLYPDWTAGEWLKADADLAAKMPGLRIALESKTDGQTCLMLVKGYIRDDDAFEFAGSMVYASVTPGAMSSTAPTETGDQVQRVGVAKSADILFFNPSIDVGEI